jgi:hypothetical protein
MRIREYRRAIAGVRVAVPSAPYSLQDIWSSKRTSGRSSGGPYRIYRRILGTVSFRPLLKSVDATPRVGLCRVAFRSSKGPVTFCAVYAESHCWAVPLCSGRVATDTIDYVATDTWGSTSTSTREVLIEAAAAIIRSLQHLPTLQIQRPKSLQNFCKSSAQQFLPFAFSQPSGTRPIQSAGDLPNYISAEPSKSACTSVAPGSG